MKNKINAGVFNKHKEINKQSVFSIIRFADYLWTIVKLLMTKY